MQSGIRAPARRNQTAARNERFDRFDFYPCGRPDGVHGGADLAVILCGRLNTTKNSSSSALQSSQYRGINCIADSPSDQEFHAATRNALEELRVRKCAQDLLIRIAGSTHETNTWGPLSRIQLHQIRIFGRNEAK